MLRKKLGLAAVLVACCVVSTAQAGLAIGDPIEGNSWSVWWGESAAPGLHNAGGPFDTFAIHMLTGDFETQGVSGFSRTDWGLEHQVGDDLVVAHGARITGSLTWYINFMGQSSAPVEFEYVCYDQDGTRRLSQLVSWSGSAWSFSDYYPGAPGGWDPGRDYLLSIPVPGAALLGAIGLGLVGWVKRRLS